MNILISILLLAIATASPAGDPEEKELSNSEVSLRFLDASGKNVSNITTTVFAHWSGSEFEQPEFSKLGHKKSGLESTLTFDKKELFDTIESRPIVLCSFQNDLRMVGLHHIKLEDWGSKIDAVMYPSCKVSGKIDGLDVEQKAELLKQGRITVYWKDWGSFSYRKCPGYFEFPMPPGEYNLKISGQGIEANEMNFEVTAGQKELDLGQISFGTTPRVKLYGKQAPDFVNLKGWLNSEPLSLDDLRGKVVILYFWGTWCNSCHLTLPLYIDLQKKYGDEELCLIGVHSDYGDSGDSIEVLEQKITSYFRKKITKDTSGKAYNWENELPFPIALDGGGEIQIEGTDRKVHGATTAAYKVVGFPTIILIDRNGNVVREIPSNRFDTKYIEAALRGE